MTHRIDKHVPMPRRHPQRPWPQMEAGDSIEITGDYREVNKLYKSGRYWVANHRPELRAVMRKLDTDTYRIWLVEREPDQ